MIKSIKKILVHGVLHWVPYFIVYSIIWFVKWEITNPFWYLYEMSDLGNHDRFMFLVVFLFYELIVGVIFSTTDIMDKSNANY